MERDGIVFQRILFPGAFTAVERFYATSGIFENTIDGGELCL
jgi:hypothetical protein